MIVVWILIKKGVPRIVSALVSLPSKSGRADWTTERTSMLLQALLLETWQRQALTRWDTRRAIGLRRLFDCRPAEDCVTLCTLGWERRCVDDSALNDWLRNITMPQDLFVCTVILEHRKATNYSVKRPCSSFSRLRCFKYCLVYITLQIVSYIKCKHSKCRLLIPVKQATHHLVLSANFLVAHCHDGYQHGS